jgi:predicted ATPase
MSKRLQVLFDEQEFSEIQEIARRHRMTVAEWVRQTLRLARQQEPLRASARKLEVLRTAAQHSFPSGDIEQILEEIERGYLSGGRR